VFGASVDLSPAKDFDQLVAFPPERSGGAPAGPAAEGGGNIEKNGEKTVVPDAGKSRFAEAYQDLRIEVRDKDNNLLVAWQPESRIEKEIPPAATAAPLPEAIATNEELYLNGLHLEQYRHATYDPRDYYLEALKRDPGDARNNNALGLWYLRRGKFSESEPYFRKAIKRITMRNPNPYDGEPYFNLGCSLKFQSGFDEAYDAF